MKKNHIEDASSQIEDENKELQITLDIPKDLKSFISDPALWPELCIYRVPRKLRARKPAAYTPQYISIGPFHHNNKALKPMEKQKLRYLAAFCERTGKDSTELAKQIKEEKVRHCYEETFEESTNKFLNMILLDSVFIIELFLRRAEKYNFFGEQMPRNYIDDFILGKSTREWGLLWDLILVENQLPYFVLDDLYEFSIPKSSEKQYHSFHDLVLFNFDLKKNKSSLEREKNENQKCTCDCFSCLLYFWIIRLFTCQRHKDGSVGKDNKNKEEDLPEKPIQKKTCNCFSCLLYFWIIRLFTCQRHKDGSVGKDNKNKEEDLPEKPLQEKPLPEKPLHFTDLFRKYRSYCHPESKNNKSVKKLYDATMLHEAGVNFKASENACSIDIKFKRGELKMPIFEADDTTELVIRNLMAFEQCHYPDQPLICDYISILDFLINTEKDVDLLVRKEIIVNLLGDNKTVAKLVNNLCLEIIASGSCFYDLSEALNKHCENPLCRTMAILRSVYFSNLWRGTGTVAAIALLVFTFTQFLDCIKII